MKKFYFSMMALFLFISLSAQNVDFGYNLNLKSILVSGINYNTGAYIAKDVNGNAVSIDTNGDSEIQISEALNIYQLNLNNYDFNANYPFPRLNSLDGLQYFTNLTYLNIKEHNIANINLTSLTNLIELNCDANYGTVINLTGLTNLKTLSCMESHCTSLDLSTLVSLENLNCQYNWELASLNLSQNTQLKNFNCSYGGLISLNISGLNNLETIYAISCRLTSVSLNGLGNLKTLVCNDNNYLASLVLTGLGSLEELNCSRGRLPNLELLGLNSLKTIDCSNNRLTTLNLSSLRNILTLRAGNNLLESLFIKNGTNWCGYSCSFNLSLSGNSNLRYICAEDRLISTINTILSQSGISNCEVNSYCSFVPAGVYYTINGNSTFDSNNNGCDSSDYLFTNLKYSIADAASTVNVIANISGNYPIPVGAGTFTVTPILENQSYFNVSPLSSSVTFPTQGSSFTQDFCITANGVRPDLKIVLLAINDARPGFDTEYRLVFKNKGNQIQSGSVNLTFEDAVLDLVSSTPMVSNQTTNNLTWDFSNLQPFETREISFVLNVNSPVENPPVNNGDFLEYTATIVSPSVDEIPRDNTFIFNQRVVGSFDPNDKTCLEGATIAPSEVGKDVHYLIRFENTGTYAAENIVVKDIIDVNKFDINSLEPISSSHSFVTKVSSSNKVEFIFENINLPFDDANNDGYVAFKIKTKPTLVTGNTFSNSASIYFDYNFPIVTNTAVTTIQALSTQDFAFGTYFTVYPNPVNNVLNIETKQTIEVSSVSIYNQLGQLVLVIPNAQNTKSVDVSSLSSGNYFIKINSDKGISNAKFIKK